MARCWDGMEWEICMMAPELTNLHDDVMSTQTKNFEECFQAQRGRAQNLHCAPERDKQNKLVLSFMKTLDDNNKCTILTVQSVVDS